jgi:hypothetical protein
MKSMKRTLKLLLIVLALFLVAGSALAKPRKTKTSKPKTVDRKAPEADERHSDPDRLKRARVATARKQQGVEGGEGTSSTPAPIRIGPATERKLTKASSRLIDLRRLPQTRPTQKERPEREGPSIPPIFVVPPTGRSAVLTPNQEAPGIVATAVAPAPLIVFEGLDRFNWGSGSPPDTNGDVGPTYYIQTVNSSVGIYDKAGNQQAAFTFDTLMSQGAFGNQCDTENFGDPVVLYDTFEDRWVLTDFAFTLDGGGNVNPPIAFQCFAVSMNGNPLTGGWNFYSITITDGLNDYPKFGIWPDGLYMSANLFGYPASSTFIKARAWAFNKYQMYAGSPTVQVVSFDITGGDSTVVPSNARLQTGTPPAGRSNYFLSASSFLNALSIYKFHVDWNIISNTTFTGPDIPISATSWVQSPAAIPQSGTAQTLDTLSPRSMVQNQYTTFAPGVESLWVNHTVRRAAAGAATPRWYQVNVNGGNVNLAIPQAANWDPDGNNNTHRWMGSLALDRGGNLALGYSTSGSALFPSIKYAGRLATDPINTFSYTEQTMFAGTASQTSSTRWGDYSSMTLDPDGCTFWYTTEYANPANQAFNFRWLTKIGSFRYPECTMVGAGGTITGTVTVTPGGTPISGATITFGARTTTTNGSGVYSFLNIPAGSYPQPISATKPGYSTASASNIVVTDGGTTTQDFALSVAPTSACATDTTQTDFLLGVATNVDLTTAPGDVTLLNAPNIDQQNTAGTTTGTGIISNANWAAQTFTAGVTGQLVKVDFPLFCSSSPAGTPCTLNPNLNVSIRATSGGLPTGANLASASIAGNISGATATFTATFASPLAITAGTQYALIVNTGSTGAATTGYFWIRSSPSTYANGQRVASADSGVTWAADSTRDYNFHTYVQTGYAPTGNLVSSNKDSNPIAPLTPIWSTLSWNGSTPPNTSLQFQVAGSNNAGGPFTFVGPDGTAGTFYTTSPGALTSLYNRRYAKYKAYLATTNNAVTPVINDVSMCFNNVDCSVPITITPTPAIVCPNSTGNSASGPAGATSYAWSITNGTITSATNIQTITYTAGPSGNVGLTLNIVEAGGCQKSANTNVPIDVPPAQPTITGNTSFCTGSSTTLMSSSATGYQWYLNGGLIPLATNQTYIVTTGNAGNYTVQVTNAAGCNSPVSAITTVTEYPVPATPTATNTGPYCDSGSGVTVQLNTPTVAGATYAWTGPTGFTSALQNPTRSGATPADSGPYSVTVTVNSCTSAAGSTTVNIYATPATPTATNTGPYCDSGSGVTVQLNTPTVAGATYAWTGPTGFTSALQNPTRSGATTADAGPYSVTVTVNGCTSAAGSTTVVINNTPATPTATNTGPYCPTNTIQLNTPAVAGATYAWTGPGGFTSSLQNPTRTNATTADGGPYSVTVTVNGCTSAAGSTTVVVNATPATPTATNTGPYCNSGSGVTVQLNTPTVAGATYAWTGPTGFTSSLQNPTRSGATAADAGPYSVTVTVNSCTSAAGSTTVVINNTPATPTATNGGPYCPGNTIQLNTPAVAGATYAWTGPGGFTSSLQNPTRSGATAADGGSYSVTVTVSGCTSAAGSTTVVVNPTPATPTASNTGPYCVGGTIQLNTPAVAGATYAWTGPGGFTSSLQNPTRAATIANAGSYSVTVTVNGCTSTAGSTTVVVNPNPDATITSASSVASNSTGNAASVANAGAGATYSWSIVNGTITGGTGTANITFTAGAPGLLTLQVTVTTAAGCSDTKSKNVTVTALPPVTVTSVVPPAGKTTGGKNVTVNGTGFVSGATITFGGNAATNVVFVNSTKLTAKTPAHAAGFVNVTVTNPDTSTGTLTNGYKYVSQQFDANGDNMVDPSDIFYLVNFLFLSGPQPAGASGMDSGDANGDGVVDPADIFYIVNYLFLGGPAPAAVAPRLTEQSTSDFGGSLSLGEPVLRGKRYFIPVIVGAAPGSEIPQALSLRLMFGGEAPTSAAIHRAGNARELEPAFEISRNTPDSLAYLLSFNPRQGLFAFAPGQRSGVIAEIEIEARPGANISVAIDPALSMLVNSGGTRSATVAGGTLQLHGTSLRSPAVESPKKERE